MNQERIRKVFSHSLAELMPYRAPSTSSEAQEDLPNPQKKPPSRKVPFVFMLARTTHVIHVPLDTSSCPQVTFASHSGPDAAGCRGVASGPCRCWTPAESWNRWPSATLLRCTRRWAESGVGRGLGEGRVDGFKTLLYRCRLLMNKAPN